MKCFVGVGRDLMMMMWMDVKMCVGIDDDGCDDYIVDCRL